MVWLFLNFMYVKHYSVRPLFLAAFTQILSVRLFVVLCAAAVLYCSAMLQCIALPVSC